MTIPTDTIEDHDDGCFDEEQWLMSQSDKHTPTETIEDRAREFTKRDDDFCQELEGCDSGYCTCRAMIAFAAAFARSEIARDREERGETIIKAQALRKAAKWVTEMTFKYGRPVGNKYDEGQNDMGYRISKWLDARAAEYEAKQPKDKT